MTSFSSRDIKQRKFKQSLMGFDADEVKSFLKIVAMEFDQVLSRNSQMEKKLSEQTLRSSFGGRKETEKDSGKNRKSPEEADRTAEEIIARAGDEACDIRQKAEHEAGEVRRKAERDAHERARRETALMLSQAKVMADEIILNAKHKAEEILTEAKAGSAPSLTLEGECPPISPAKADERPGFDGTEPDSWDMKHAEDAQKSFDSIIGEAMAKAESIIQDSRAEAEMITHSLIGRTLGELNREHERLLAAVQNAVHKSEQIVRTAREEAEKFAVQRNSNAVEQCNAVLIEAEQKAEAIFSSLRSRAAARKSMSDGNGKRDAGIRRPTSKFQ